MTDQLASEIANAAEDGDRIDGRTARGMRTRAAVVDAMLDLIDEGDLRPTAPRIAERAGVSLRSVFQHFKDLDSLFVEAAQRQLERLKPVLDEDLPVDGPIAARIDRLVDQRARLWEAATPLRRAAQLSEFESQMLANLLQAAHDARRADLVQVFADEIERDPEVLDALDLVTSWSAWDALRTRQHLDVEAAAAVVRRTLRKLVL